MNNVFSESLAYNQFCREKKKNARKTITYINVIWNKMKARKRLRPNNVHGLVFQIIMNQLLLIVVAPQ